MINKNIVPVRNLLKMLSVEDLRNPEVIANLVRIFGIVQHGLVGMFGEEECYKNSNKRIAGIYQNPNQIASALVYLSQFKFNSYCEIGVFQGGNFLFVSDYLSRFNPDIVCTGVDPTDYLNDDILEVINGESRYNYFKGTSFDLAREKFDLVFIDGRHKFRWVRRDWNNLGNNAKICMFHDIQEWSCPDVVAFWNWIKENYPDRKKLEFLQNTYEKPSLGIGIIHNI